MFHKKISYSYDMEAVELVYHPNFLSTYFENYKIHYIDETFETKAKRVICPNTFLKYIT